MQQLSVITASTNCLDQGVEISGSRNTGHCQYTHTHTHRCSQLCYNQAAPAEPAGHSFCPTKAQNIQEAYSKAQRKRVSLKGYVFTTVKTAHVLIKRKAASGESRDWERGAIIVLQVTFTQKNICLCSERQSPACEASLAGNGWYPLLPPMWEPGKCSLSGGRSLA